MKRALLTILIFAFAFACHAQDAKVIQLSPSDAAEAKSLYAQQKELDAKFADLRYRITKNYLTASKEEEGHTNTYSDPHGAGWVWVKNGWGTGNFNFSEDFRFIVPSNPLPTMNIYGGSYLNPVCFSTLTGTSTSTGILSITPSSGAIQ